MSQYDDEHSATSRGESSLHNLSTRSDGSGIGAQAHSTGCETAAASEKDAVSGASSLQRASSRSADLIQSIHARQASGGRSRRGDLQRCGASPPRDILTRSLERRSQAALERRSQAALASSTADSLDLEQHSQAAVSSRVGSGAGQEPNRLATCTPRGIAESLMSSGAGSASSWVQGGGHGVSHTPLRACSIPRTHSVSTLTLQPACSETNKLNIDTFKGSTLLNQYLLIKSLGQGAHGKVKLCMSSLDLELYAVKMVSKVRGPRSRRPALQLPSSGTAASRSDSLALQGEVNIMRMLHHPNIVQLVEVIDDPQALELLLVMDFVEGGPVLTGDRPLQKNRLPESVACRFFRDVALGVEYMHARGVYHGDLKPDNMLLSADCSVKIADFGSSHVVGGGGLMVSTAGTPAFMPPEVVAGAPYAAFPADIWALGVSLYMFVYGFTPFRGDAILKLYDNIRTGGLHFPTHPLISGSLRDLLARMLDKEPSSRIDMAGILSHPALLAGALRPPPSPWGRDGDSSGEGGVAMDLLVGLLSREFEARSYNPGEVLAKQGQWDDTIFYIESGSCEIHQDARVTPDEDFANDEDEDSEEEEAVSTGLGRFNRRPELKRSNTVIRRLLNASLRAGEVIDTLKPLEAMSEASVMRKAGEFIGEVSLFEDGQAGAHWRTSVRALTPVRALLLTRDGIHHLLQTVPEAEAELRAAMAKRKWELLHLEAVERLAAFRRQLAERVEPSQLRTALNAIIAEAGGLALAAPFLTRNSV